MPSSQDAYARAGVDVSKVKDIHSHLLRLFERTFDARKGRFGKPVGKLGHYAGLVDIGQRRLLALHVDGVGTKVLVAQLMNRFDTVGIDCVAMCVNDLICMGAEPFALIDYLALERADDELVAKVAEGLAEGAMKASVAIVGGETAVMGDVIKGIDGRGFDLAAMAIGVVRNDSVVDGGRIRIGDSIIGVASSGIHANGLTLARKVLLKEYRIGDYMPELGKILGEELLEPTMIYVKPVLESIKKCEIHGFAHITGGAFTKLKRLIGDRRLKLVLDKMPPPQPVFSLIQRLGRIPRREMYGIFNMGVGFCVFAPEYEVREVVEVFGKNNIKASKIGTVERGEGIVVGKERLV